MKSAARCSAAIVYFSPLQMKTAVSLRHNKEPLLQRGYIVSIECREKEGSKGPLFNLTVEIKKSGMSPKKSTAMHSLSRVGFPFFCVTGKKKKNTAAFAETALANIEYSHKQKTI